MTRLFALFLFAVVGISSSLHAAQHPQLLTLGMDRTAPFAYAGQLLFTSGASDYVGSGTVVRPRSILTAGHNIYDPSTGWSTQVEFRRANYGPSALTDVFASRIYLLGGYQAQVQRYGSDDVRSFAYDSAGVVYPTALAGGHVANVSYAGILLNSNFLRIAIGYGAEGNHTGDYPLFVRPTTNFGDVYGSFFENTSIYFEGGMSGGPLFSYYNGTYYVVGVIVSGAVNPDAGGIHYLDTSTFNFIYRYLL